MSRDPSDNSKLPPWLRDVPLPPRPGAPQPARPSEPEPVPEWLRDSGAAGAAPLPPWLMDDTPSAPPAPAPQPDEAPLPAWLMPDAAPSAAPAGSEDLPDWLKDLPPSASADPPASDERWLAAAETPPTPAAEEDVPDWLRALADQPATSEPKPAEDLPDWLRPSAESDSAPETPAAPAAPAPAAPPEPESHSPFWLDAPAEPQDEPATPSWLADVGGGDLPRTDEPSAPDWLSSPPAAPAAPEEAPADLDTGDVTPFSLADLGLGGDETPPSPPSQPAATPDWLTGFGGTSDEDAPAWLSAETPTPTEPDAPAAPPETQGSAGWLSDEVRPTPDMPPWLSADDTAAGAQNPEASGAGADIPPWLAETTPAAGAQQETSAADLPSWLAADTPAATPTEPAADIPSWLAADTPAATPTEPADVPAWLRDLTGGVAEPPAAAMPAEPTPPPAEEDIPAWLRAVEPSAPASEGAAAGTPQAEDLPDWLRSAATPAAPETPQPPPAAAPASDLPDWLRGEAAAAPGGDALPPWLRDEMGQPLPTAAAPGEAGLPEWLRGAASETPAAPAASESVKTPASETTSERGPFDWFDDDQPAAPADSGELLGGAELPAWLAAETAPKPKPDPAAVDTRSVEWLTRLGVQEDEGVATTAAAPVRLAPPRVAARSAAQIEATALLRQLAAEPYPAAEVDPPPAPLSIWRRLGLERALYLLLLAAVLVGLLAPGLTVTLQGPPQATDAEGIFAQIESLGANDVVLVGYEWDARRISELRPLERAVLDHLIRRQVKLVLVSTDPQGTLLLFDLRDRLTEAQYRQNGEGYLLLGYKPGGELALRSMAQDFQGTLRADFSGGDANISALATGLDTGRPLTSVRDFAMTVVLADEAGDVQAWMEQINPAVGAADGQPRRPMLFLLPAEAAPIVQPYLVQPEVHALAGYQGALAYQALTGQPPAERVAEDSARLRFATLAFVLLLLVGGFAAALSRALASRRVKP